MEESEETKIKNTGGLPAHPEYTYEGVSSLSDKSVKDSAVSTSKTMHGEALRAKSPASTINSRVLSPQEAPPNNKPNNDPSSSNPTNNKVISSSTSDEDTSINNSILNQPEIFDEDEDPAFIFACTQNPLLRYFHKRGPEWWAAYNQQLQKAKDAPLPTGEEEDAL
ncbi:hypothetical protein G7Y89_g4194 [Cudoniella acicularis]|uniref:Uncharacterized protein n=1 Tax=Cudoniella acicularis TaxID=354080 RepID=A0A8H4RPY6_9HELO|nr:hypothetical protein G7Y89_g4194 [Cudoniella acicularis]